MDETYQRRPDIRDQQVGTERMLLDESANCVHVLNGTAAFIWDCLGTPVTVGAIRSRLDAEYDLSKVPDAVAVIRRTLATLQSKQLLERVPQRGGPAGQSAETKENEKGGVR